MRFAMFLFLLSSVCFASQKVGTNNKVNQVGNSTFDSQNENTSEVINLGSSILKVSKSMDSNVGNSVVKSTQPISTGIDKSDVGRSLNGYFLILIVTLLFFGSSIKKDRSIHKRKE